MTEKFFMGIDAGTSIVKSVVFNGQGREIAISRRKVPIETPRPGWAEQDMDLVWDKVKETIREVLQQSKINPSHIAGVGVAGQGDGCRLLDRSCQPIRKAILWLDGRGGDIVTRWEKEGIDQAGFQISGSTTFAGSPRTIIKWLEKNEIHSLGQAHHFLFAKDWIKLKLTGQISTDFSDASRGLIDIRRRRLSDDLFRLFGLSPYKKLFPPIKASTEIMGEVTTDADEETGLCKGTPVISGMIDVVAAPVGMGAIYHGEAFSIIGSTCFNGVTTDRLILDPVGVGVTLLHALPGKFIRAMPAMAGTPNIDWFIREFCQTEKKGKEESLYQLLEEKIREVPLGSEGVLYHPYISPGGERAPFVKPSAKAQFFGIGLMHSRWHLLHSVYEGVALSMLDCFNHIPVQISEIRASGGGVRSHLWCQMFADVTGKDIRVPQESEIGALGTAICVGVGTGIYKKIEDAAEKMVRFKSVYKPNHQNHQKYQGLYQLYRSTYQHLWNDWDLRHRLMKSWSVSGGQKNHLSKG